MQSLILLNTKSSNGFVKYTKDEYYIGNKKNDNRCKGRLKKKTRILIIVC